MQSIFSSRKFDGYSRNYVMCESSMNIDLHLLNVFHCKYFYVVTSSWGPGSTGLPGEQVASVSDNLKVIRPPQSVGHDSQCKSSHTNKM